MFNTQERLAKRTPAGGIGREEFIEHLVEEFHITTDVEAQEQITANLANFAYDPINYPFLEKSDALQIFLQAISLPNDRLVLHGIAGICNLCLCSSFSAIICSDNNLPKIIELLTNDDTEIVLNAMTTLYYLIGQIPRNVISQFCIAEKVLELQKSSTARIRNLSQVIMCQLS